MAIYDPYLPPEIAPKEEIFAVPCEFVFDDDDGFLKQRLLNGEWLPLFHWQTAEDMLDEQYNKIEFNRLLYNHPDEFVELVRTEQLNETLISAGKYSAGIITNITNYLGGGQLNSSIAREIMNG